MKKIFMLLVTVLMCISMSAQSVVKTEDGKYDVYCDVMGYNTLGIGRLKVELDMGYRYNGQEANSLYDENNKKIKFNSMMEVLDYMGKRGWTVVTTYSISKSGNGNVIIYLLKKRVSNDEEKKEGLNIQKD